MSVALIHSRASAQNRRLPGDGDDLLHPPAPCEGALIAQRRRYRVYRIRNHRIDQLSFDHSLVWNWSAARNQLPTDARQNSRGPRT